MCMYILHLVTSLKKSSSHPYSHPHFLPQKQSRLPASCRNLRKTKETAYLYFIQGRAVLGIPSQGDGLQLTEPARGRTCGGGGVPGSWPAGSGPAAHRPLRLSAATRLAVTHQELKMPWRRSNKASVKFNYRISYLLLDLIA